MYLFAKFGGHTSYRNEIINSYINSYMDTLEKTELTASILRIAIFSKPGIPIYNSEVSDTADRNTRRRKRRRTQTTAERYAFHANAIKGSQTFYHIELYVFFPVFIRFRVVNFYL